MPNWPSAQGRRSGGPRAGAALTPMGAIGRRVSRPLPVRSRSARVRQRAAPAPAGTRVRRRAQLGGSPTDAVVKQRRLYALQPLRAIVDERLAQPRARAPLAHMFWWDPGFRQSPLAEQRAQPARVLAIGLRSALAPAQRARLHRLGQMSDCTSTLERRERTASRCTPPARPALATLEACNPRPPRPASRSAHASLRSSSRPPSNRPNYNSELALAEGGPPSSHSNPGASPSSLEVLLSAESTTLAESFPFLPQHHDPRALRTGVVGRIRSGP